jgi:cytochrome c
MTGDTRPHCGALELAGIAALLGLLALPQAYAGDAQHGEAVFKACAACHTERPSALGPSLRGVYGRKAGTLDDFHYSAAMKRADFVWDAGNLKAYITDPQAKVKGNRMPFSGLQNPADIDDVIAYVQTLK